MQAQTLAIETVGLTKQFGQHRAVDTLHLAIHTGSLFGFLGPNCHFFQERSSPLDSQRLLEENVCSLTLRRSRDV